jgi:GTP pyrophosphokinase/guanosine-3',5'-bis(diphosphate) 3'-pyrophosphohydrolase
MHEQGSRPDAVTLTLGRFQDDEEASPAIHGVVIDGSEGASVQLARCCRPIPGDEIRGYLGRGEGLVVHTVDCSVGQRQMERDPERWTTVEWSEQPTRAFDTQLAVMVKNGQGVLAQIAQGIAKTESDIIHIAMDNDPMADAVELQLVLAVRDRQHLADVLRSLKRLSPVLRAQRVKP